ncbi:MAG: TPM domain-containing protein [Bacteroidales bacterium]|nr:TPM domain-containing protein [Bacteroidales bacterium]
MNPFLSKEEQQQIISAIEEAELNTSGEIRVHIESKCRIDAVARAIYVFNYLKMYKTRQRNGVLVYIATESRKLAIIGDVGINQKVPADFWNHIKENMVAAFAAGNFVGGIAEAVRAAGNSLKEYFPYQQDDVNEQPNEISFGDELPKE